MLLSQMVPAERAAAYDPDCSKACAAAANDCSAKAKDSPNEIDRTLCIDEMADCERRCEEDYRSDLEQKNKEKEQAVQDQKATWDAQGLTPEQQQAERLRQQEQEDEKAHEESDVRHQQERDQLEKARQEREPQERGQQGQ